MDHKTWSLIFIDTIDNSFTCSVLVCLYHVLEKVHHRSFISYKTNWWTLFHQHQVYIYKLVGTDHFLQGNVLSKRSCFHRHPSKKRQNFLPELYWFIITCKCSQKLQLDFYHFDEENFIVRKMIFNESHLLCHGSRLLEQNDYRYSLEKDLLWK